MRNGFTTLVNPATPVSAPAASPYVREKIRVLAQARRDHGRALNLGVEDPRLELRIAGAKELLGTLYVHPSSTYADRVALARALGIPEPHGPAAFNNHDDPETEEV